MDAMVFGPPISDALDTPVSYLSKDRFLGVMYYELGESRTEVNQNQKPCQEL